MKSSSHTNKVVRLQFGFEENVPANSSEHDFGFVELPLAACRISGLVQMLAEMEGCGNDDEDDNNNGEGGGASGTSSPPSVLIVGIELPGAGGIDRDDEHHDAATTTTGSESINNLLDMKALLSVKTFLLGVASSSSTAGATAEGGGGGSVVPVPLPNAVTGVNYYLNTLLCANDRAILVGMLPPPLRMVLGSGYSVEIPQGGGEEEEDPMLGLKRLLHLASYLQIEPLVNLVAGYFAAAFIEICRRPAAVSSSHGGSSGSGAATTPATQAACAIRQLKRVGHDWTRDEQATIMRHTDW